MDVFYTTTLVLRRTSLDVLKRIFHGSLGVEYLESPDFVGGQLSDSVITILDYSSRIDTWAHSTEMRLSYL
jgi:hypothetical protein